MRSMSPCHGRQVRGQSHTSHTGARNHWESSVRRRERGRRQCRVSCSAWFNDTQVLSVRWLRDPRVLFAQRWWTEVLLPVPRGQSLARLSTKLTVSGHKPLAKQFRNFWGEITAAFITWETRLSRFHRVLRQRVGGECVLPCMCFWMSFFLWNFCAFVRMYERQNRFHLPVCEYVRVSF